MAQTPAERARAYRRRQRVKRGTQNMVLVGQGNTSARKHGAYAADVDQAAQERLPGMPGYLDQPQFHEAVQIARRRVVMAERLGVWIAGLTEEQQVTPTRPGSASPAEISRQHDETALRSLAQLGLTPASAARFGRALEDSERPDLALIQMAAMEAQDDGA